MAVRALVVSTLRSLEEEKQEASEAEICSAIDAVILKHASEGIVIPTLEGTLRTQDSPFLLDGVHRGFKQLLCLIGQDGKPAVSIAVRDALGTREDHMEPLVAAGNLADGCEGAPCCTAPASVVPGARLDALGRSRRQLIVSDPMGSWLPTA
mmetsp:Transcript_60223/g.142703  ORF Transcript_60223/g.142703 Transcript_60223/m.142703 type:complete len:152 (+) Transcript_60223:3-458(+)